MERVSEDHCVVDSRMNVFCSSEDLVISEKIV